MKQLLLVCMLILAVSISFGQNGWSVQVDQIGHMLTWVSAVDLNVGWTAGRYGGPILRTVDGGLNWKLVTTPFVSGNIEGIEAVDSNVAMIFSNLDVGGHASIWRTTDGGATWQEAYSSVTSTAYIDDLEMVSADVGYALGDPEGGKWQLLKTTDRGATWNQMASAPPQTGSEVGMIFSFATLGADRLWFGSGLKMYKSTDAGATWSSARNTVTGSQGPYAGIRFADEQKGVTLTFGNAGMWSEDGGVTWTDFLIPGVSEGGESYLSGIRSDFYISRLKKIYRSTNGGKNWFAVFTQTSTSSFTTLDFVEVGGAIRGWAVAWGGPIVTYYEAPTSVEGNHTSTQPASFALHQNYPNPFNPSTTMSYELPMSSQVTLTVHDVLGQKVATLENGEQDAGRHQVEFNASNLSSGTYFYTLQAGEYRETRRLLFCK